MNVKELIEALKKYPEDATVFMKKKRLRENNQGYFMQREDWLPFEEENINVTKFNKDAVFFGEL